MASSYSTSTFLVLVLVATIVLLSSTKDYLVDAQSTQQDYLNAHNAARGQVLVANIVWNATLATYAQNYANARVADCALVPSGGPYGENLAKGSSSAFSGTSAVNLWVAEKPYYDYASNACTGGQQCVHYTQVVWANSVGVGCARVQCVNGWYFVTCNYWPRGNVAGERPY